LAAVAMVFATQERERTMMGIAAANKEPLQRAESQPSFPNLEAERERRWHKALLEGGVREARLLGVVSHQVSTS